MIVVASDVHRQHHGLELNDGAMAPSEEGPQRADMIAEALGEAGYDSVAPGSVGDELLGRVHSVEYIEFLATAWKRWCQLDDPGPAAMGFTWPGRGITPHRPDDLIGQLGYHSFAADCSIVAGTWNAVRESASIACSAASAVADGARTAYGLCRPPGHHATVDQFGGYCYVNNAAVAAQHLLDRGAARVGVLDVDYHHGNGTQDIFYGRSDVLTVSLHADPTFEFPWFVGRSTESGAGDGDGWNLNLPLAAGTTFDVWNEALSVALDRITTGGVEALVVALGVDTYSDDPLGTFVIDTQDYAQMSARIAALGLPMVIVQEGGYAVEAIGRNVVSFLSSVT